jgi:hypothetical protein
MGRKLRSVLHLEPESAQHAVELSQL